MVARNQDAKDKRAQHLNLTQKGHDLRIRATEAITSGEGQCFEKLSEGERLLLAELLHKVARSSVPK